MSQPDRHTLAIKTAADIDKALQGLRALRNRLDEGWTLILTRKRRDRQNNLLWMWLSIISKKLLWHGQYWTPEQWKDCLIHSYKGGCFMPGAEGGMVPIGNSSSVMGVKEFAEFLDCIHAFAAQHDIELPDPEDLKADRQNVLAKQEESA